MRPTANDEPVRRKIWYGSATSRSWLPLNEMSWPIQSSRYERDSRNGAVSGRRS